MYQKVEVDCKSCYSYLNLSMGWIQFCPPLVWSDVCHDKDVVWVVLYCILSVCKLTGPVVP
jgi:hypothetical protein